MCVGVVYWYAILCGGLPNQRYCDSQLLFGREWEVINHPDLQYIVFHSGNILTLHTKGSPQKGGYPHLFCYKVNEVQKHDKTIRMEFYMRDELKEITVHRRNISVKITHIDQASLSADQGVQFQMKRIAPRIMPK